MLQIPSHGQKVVNSIVEAVKIDKQNKIFVQLLWGQNSLTARPEYRGRQAAGGLFGLADLNCATIPTTDKG